MSACGTLTKRNVILEIIVKPPLELAQVFVDLIAAVARDSSDRHALVSLALPGGSVAETFLPIMATADFDWRRVDWFWVDERAVPPDHADSNYRLAHDLLFSRVDVDAARVHRMKGEAPDLAASAADYERDTRSTLGETPRFDVVLLGVGPDGHVGSLFPGHHALDEASRMVVAIDDAPKPPPRRLTLTLPAMAGSLVVIAAFGATKTAVIREALHDPESRLPVARAARGARRAYFLLDAAAAAESV